MQEWLDALHANGKQPEPRDGGRYYLAFCPAHDDRKKKSLSVQKGNTAEVVVKCFVGCTFVEIVNALGIARNADLRGRQPKSGQNPISVQQRATTPPPRVHKRIPSGSNIQRWDYFDANGKFAFAAIRQDPGKRFSQWTPVEGGYVARGPQGPKPIYLLKAVLQSTGKVAIVEGEKCVHACLAAWPNQTTTTWAGGTNTWQNTDWEPLRGREVSLVADADPPNKKTQKRPGHDAMRALAAHLHGLGCNVKIALPMPVGDEPDDVADWIATDGKEAAGEKIGALLQPYRPALTDNANQTNEVIQFPAPAEPEDDDDVDAGALRSNEHYRVIGMAGAYVAVRLNRAGQIVQRSRESMIQPATLISFAPATWWCKLTGAADVTKKMAMRVGDSLIRIADEEGQVDTTSFIGPGAAIVGTKQLVYHLGDRLLENGKIIDLDVAEFPTIAGPPIPLAESATDDEMRDFAQAMMLYRWESSDHARRVLGWMTIAVIGGAVEWRPHLYFVAPPGSGKSWILKRIVQFFGPLGMHISDATPASLARMTGNSGLPLVVDEANADAEWVSALFGLMRIAAGSDGSRIRATASENGVSATKARFCALVATHAPRLLENPDETRVVPIRLGPAVQDWISVKDRIDAAIGNADRVRARIIRDAKQIIDDASGLARVFEAHAMDSRAAMIGGALTAGWHQWMVDNRTVYPRDRQVDIMDHAAVLLQEIMNIRHRENALEQDLATFVIDEPARAAQLYGVRIDENDILCIASKHPGLNGALRRAGMRNVDITDSLLQINGAMRSDNPLRFGSYRQRAICLRPEALETMGIVLSTNGVVDAESESLLSNMP